MKKNLFAWVALATLSFGTTACANNGVVASKNYVTKKVKVGRFDGVSANSSIDIVYTQTSGSQDVEIYAPDNLIEYIQVYVENGILVAKFKSSKQKINIGGMQKKEVRVSAPAIHTIKAASSGDVILKNGLETDEKVTLSASSSGDIEGGKVICDKLVAKASSSGDIDLEKVKCQEFIAEAASSGDVEIDHLTAETVEAEASSSGDVILSGGKCVQAKLAASSSGDVVAKDLKADHVTASASSAGDVSCYPVESLKAKSSSAGSVGYRGNPKDIDYSPKKGLHKID